MIIDNSQNKVTVVANGKTDNFFTQEVAFTIDGYSPRPYVVFGRREYGFQRLHATVTIKDKEQYNEYVEMIGKTTT